MKLIIVFFVLALATGCSSGNGFNPVSGPIADEINRHISTEGCDTPLRTNKIATMIEPIVNSRLRSAGARADVDLEVSLKNCPPAG